MIEVAQAVTQEQISEVRSLLEEYMAWVLTIEVESRNAPTFQGYEEELAMLPGIYGPPSGRLLLARLNGEPAGCVALKRRDSECGELKRLYVRPACRGNNIGGRLVEALIAEASDCDYRRLTLDSHISMVNAHTIYRNAGFRVVEPPAGFPEVYTPVVVFMEKELTSCR